MQSAADCHSGLIALFTISLLAVLTVKGVTPQLVIPTPCPNGAKFCENAPDYPTNLINELLKKETLSFKQQKSNGKKDHVMKKRVADLDNPDDVSMCKSNRYTIFPKKGLSEEGSFEFIVNQQSYIQGIKVELCMSEDQQCQVPGSNTLTLLNGYTFLCRQRYMTQYLLALNRNTTEPGGVVNKPFLFPSCCACTIKSIPITTATSTAPVQND